MVVIEVIVGCRGVVYVRIGTVGEEFVKKDVKIANGNDWVKFCAAWRVKNTFSDVD